MRIFNKGRRGADEGVATFEVGDVDYGSAHKETGMFGDRGHPDDVSQVATSLGKGSHIAGKLSFEGTVRIDGQVEGEIAAQESVVIGETAIVKAQVTADSVIITGRVTGDIIARRRVEIRAPGKLYGNITTPSLVIHDGVVFEGRCSMGATDAQKSERSVDLLGAKDERGQESAGLGTGSEVEWSASH
jgi:cytoskeletal protein CcmA (bactofilin family)